MELNIIFSIFQKNLKLPEIQRTCSGSHYTKGFGVDSLNSLDESWFLSSTNLNCVNTKIIIIFILIINDFIVDKNYIQKKI